MNINKPEGFASWVDALLYTIRRENDKMTFDEALAAGWTLSGSSWYRGYVSRKVDPMKQELHRAGSIRSGQWYVDLPAIDGVKSTRYHVRQYLKPPAGLLPE